MASLSSALPRSRARDCCVNSRITEAPPPKPTAHAGLGADVTVRSPDRSPLGYTLDTLLAQCPPLLGTCPAPQDPRSNPTPHLSPQVLA